MLYNELISEVIKRVDNMPKSINSSYNMTFKEALELFLEDFEHDVLLSQGERAPALTEDTLADAEFEKKLDEELAGEAIYKGSWVD